MKHFSLSLPLLRYCCRGLRSTSAAQNTVPVSRPRHIPCTQNVTGLNPACDLCWMSYPWCTQSFLLFCCSALRLSTNTMSAGVLRLSYNGKISPTDSWGFFQDGSSEHTGGILYIRRKAVSCNQRDSVVRCEEGCSNRHNKTNNKFPAVSCTACLRMAVGADGWCTKCKWLKKGLKSFNNACTVFFFIKLMSRIIQKCINPTHYFSLKTILWQIDIFT